MQKTYFQFLLYTRKTERKDKLKSFLSHLSVELIKELMAKEVYIYLNPIKI